MQARWFWVVTVLAMASSLASSWRPAPGTPSTVVNVAKLLPPIFTASSGQGVPTIVCTKKPAAGETASVVMNSATAVATNNDERPMFSTARSLNIAGPNGPAGFFAENLTLQADSYKTFKFVIDAVITVKRQVTCEIGGVTRTIWTGGNPNKQVADPSSLNAADAAPVLTEITIDGGNTSASLSVNFNVAAGATTILRSVFNTDGNAGLVVNDISVITGVANSYKITPGTPDVTGATASGP
jgi:hypothetical protein